MLITGTEANGCSGKASDREIDDLTRKERITMLSIIKMVKDSIARNGLFVAQCQSPTVANIHSVDGESK